ncbi:MAG: hypothetical protein KI790_08060 [Cyclobacteriaceae bacterium]|nr:hypothetical protein [Cyclobacteriaceae bacterium HetDA_MAG_MS6]
MATYLMAVFYLYVPEYFSPVAKSSIPMFILATFTATFVIPALSITVMKLSSRVSSLELTHREERFLPFLSITLFYAASTYMFLEKLNIIKPLSVMMISVTVLILLLSLITLKFKISIHAAALWGAVGFLCGLSLRFTGQDLMAPLLVSVVIAGVVSTSRLFQNFHTPKEVWWGTVTGFFFCLASVYLFG